MFSLTSENIIGLPGQFKKAYTTRTLTKMYIWIFGGHMCVLSKTASLYQHYSVQDTVMLIKTGSFFVICTSRVDELSRTTNNNNFCGMQVTTQTIIYV